MFWGDPNNQTLVDSVRVRDGFNFNWTTITLLVFVILVYAFLWYKKLYKPMVAGITLYSVHWFYEIMNAVIYKTTGTPLWTVTNASSSYVLLIGVSIELSLMFSVAGIATWFLLPVDRNKKLLRIPVKIWAAVGTALLAGVLEIFLTSTPAFLWVYPWWGFLPVFITTYIPFFLAAVYVPDLKPKTQLICVGSLVAINIILLVVLIPCGII